MSEAEAPEDRSMSECAQTIYEQFGGSRAMAMIGGKAIASESALVIHFKGCRKVNMVKIDYDYGMDFYGMTFYRFSGVESREVKALEGVYAEDLRGIFETETGLYLSL